MELNEFITHFADQFEDTDPAEILTGAEIRHCSTVEDLFNTIAAK